jgi:hypothetical protein
MALLSPLLADAAWWNPFSWSNSATVSQSATVNASSSVIEVIKEVPVEVVKEVEKVVTKTEYRDNPDLLAEIASLKKQLAEAKSLRCPVETKVEAKVETKVVVSGEPQRKDTKGCLAYFPAYDKATSTLAAVKQKYAEDMDYYSQFELTDEMKSKIQSIKDKYNVDLAAAIETASSTRAVLRIQCQ